MGNIVGENTNDSARSRSYDLTVMDMVVAVCFGRATVKNDHTIALAVSDKFQRPISKGDIKASMKRLIEARLMAGSAGQDHVSLTTEGCEVMADAQKACVRLLDSHTGIFILGQTAGLFDNWSEDHKS